MSAHGRSGFSRLALGSVTDKVLRGGNMPVLMVRAPREGEKTWLPSGREGLSTVTFLTKAPVFAIDKERRKLYIPTDKLERLKQQLIKFQ